MEAQEELVGLEATVSRALKDRDARSLPIVGFGELSVALALGKDRVAKRMPPFSHDEFDRYRHLIDSYCTELASRGVDVIETEVLGIPRGDQIVGYLVQPRLGAATLGDALLRDASTNNAVPSADHPVLVAMGQAVVDAVDHRVSLDGQVTNWGFSRRENGQLHPQLLDVGTPMMWDVNGVPALDMSPFLAMIPAPTRPVMHVVMKRLMDRWKEPRGVLIDALANLYRDGMPEWAEPAAITWSSQLGEELDLDAAERAWREDQRLWPFITRLKRAERWLRQRREEPYEFFIQTTFGSARFE